MVRQAQQDSLGNAPVTAATRALTGRSKPDRGPSLDRLLDVQEAAALLSVKVSTLRQWTYQRRIPVVKLGRAVRFRESDLKRLIEDSTRPALRS